MITQFYRLQLKLFSLVLFWALSVIAHWMRHRRTHTHTWMSFIMTAASPLWCVKRAYVFVWRRVPALRGLCTRLFVFACGEKEAVWSVWIIDEEKGEKPRPSDVNLCQIYRPHPNVRPKRHHGPDKPLRLQQPRCRRKSSHSLALVSLLHTPLSFLFQWNQCVGGCLISLQCPHETPSDTLKVQLNFFETQSYFLFWAFRMRQQEFCWQLNLLVT